MLDATFDLVEKWWARVLAIIALLTAFIAALRHVWSCAMKVQPFIDTIPDIASMPAKLDEVSRAVGTLSLRSALNSNLLNLFLDEQQVGYWMSDDKGNCVSINDTLAQWMGLDDETAGGSGWVSGIAHRDRIRVRERWTDTINNGVPFDEDYTYLNSKTGIETPVSVTARWVVVAGLDRKILVGMARKRDSGRNAGTSVLVVEDDTAISKVIANHLNDMGMKVSHASTLNDGMKVLGENRHDVVLLDLGLPDSFPHQTLEQLPLLRALMPDARIAILTGMVSAPDLAQHRHIHHAHGYGVKNDVLVDANTFQRWFRNHLLP